ncbi:MAG: hypothetical protein GY870_00810 [archaeon]|nr:hypothetical protein [archaeon]
MKDKLQNITIAIPEIYVKNLTFLQSEGIIRSRSDGIRIAVHQFLQKEVRNAELFGYEPKKSKND